MSYLEAKLIEVAPGVAIDFTNLYAVTANREIRLTMTEADLAAVLMSDRFKNVEEIADQLVGMQALTVLGPNATEEEVDEWTWSYIHNHSDEVGHKVRNYVNKLRDKLGPESIETAREAGYRFAANE